MAGPGQATPAARRGARPLAFDTMLKLCGLTVPDVSKIVDEVQGLATIWRLTDGARVLTF